MDASTNSGGEQNISVSQKRPRSKSPGSLSGQSGEPSRKRTETDDHGSWNHTQNGAQNWGYGGHEKNEQPPTGPRNDVGRRLHWRNGQQPYNNNHNIWPQGGGHQAHQERQTLPSHGQWDRHGGYHNHDPRQAVQLQWNNGQMMGVYHDEINQLRNQIQFLDGQNRKLRDENVYMKPEPERHRALFMDDRVQLATRNQELRDLNDKLNGVQEQLESREASIQNLSGEVENPKGENEELQRRNRNVEGELKDARTQLPESMADHANTNALLDARTAELKGAQTFLNKADLFSVGDVKRMLTTLNAEILQCSAWIVDKVFDLLGDIGQGNVTKEDLRVVDMSIGKQLRSTLEKNLVTANDPLPLQVALQVVPINHCSNILRKFDPTNDTANTAFQATYDLICATHDVAIAGRWRSIAMAQLTNSQKFGFDMSAVVSTIQTVISVAGGSRTRQSDPSCSTFVQSIEEHLEPVKKAVAILKHAIGQGITSLDLLPLVWAYSQPYDWKIMELSYGDEGEKACEGRLGTGIIGTIDIGLEIVSKRGHDGPARAETDIVVFPKIVLPETLEEVMTIASKGISGSSVVIDIL